MRNKILSAIVIFLVVLVIGCEINNDKKLPYLGRKEINGSDTIYHTITNFRFVNQDSNFVTHETFKDQIYISDFFFTSCPSICPIMKTQMLRIHDEFKENSLVAILSHTIDPKHDSVAVLKEFAENLRVESKKWHFVTGNKEEIYKIGQTGYMVTAVEDFNAPGGFMHSGAFILVDMKRRVRGVYDGTKEEQVSILINDIKTLLKEYD